MVIQYHQTIRGPARGAAVADYSDQKRCTMTAVVRSCRSQLAQIGQGHSTRGSTLGVPRKDFARMPLDLPIAVSIFKGDMFTPPKVWGERTYSKLFYWNDVPKGGHFAALEQPELFVSELRKAFRQVR
jgi:pimeloyl-ACP methyl ester carboxylesterase